MIKRIYVISFHAFRSVKWLAVTRSGAVNARRLFPCVDEPDSKAKFTVEIAHDKNYISLSNTYEDDHYTLVLGPFQYIIPF